MYLVDTVGLDLQAFIDHFNNGLNKTKLVPKEEVAKRKKELKNYLSPADKKIHHMSVKVFKVIRGKIKW